MKTDQDGPVPENENQEQNQSPSEFFLQFDRLQEGDPNGEQMCDTPEKKRRHAHHYGIGRYRSFSNHSSAGDQPHTNTGW